MSKKSDQYKHKLDYNSSYNRANYRSFSVRFNVHNESDIIQWLEKQESIKTYLNKLIRNDMEKHITKTE